MMLVSSFPLSFSSIFFFSFLIPVFDFLLLLLSEEKVEEEEEGEGRVHIVAHGVGKTWQSRAKRAVGRMDGTVRVLLPAWLLTCLPGCAALLSRGAALAKGVFLVFSFSLSLFCLGIFLMPCTFVDTIMLSLCHAVGKNNILAQLDIKLECRVW